MLHLNIKIYGYVQGVFFRTSAKEQAEKLNIKGYAKNLSDGSVYIEAEGSEQNLDKFSAWCKQGPEMANVEKIEISENSLKNFKEFQAI